MGTESHDRYLPHSDVVRVARSPGPAVGQRAGGGGTPFRAHLQSHAFFLCLTLVAEPLQSLSGSERRSRTPSLIGSVRFCKGMWTGNLAEISFGK